MNFLRNKLNKMYVWLRIYQWFYCLVCCRSRKYRVEHAHKAIVYLDYNNSSSATMAAHVLPLLAGMHFLLQINYDIMSKI